jgi:hypothetical protein
MFGSSSSSTVRDSSKQKLIRFSQLTVGLLVGLLATEGMFWWRDRGAFPHLNIYQADEKLGARLLPHATTKIRFGNNPLTHVRTNNLGFRGPDWPAVEENEVVVVGDSQVFGLGVEEEQTFSKRLEENLGTSFHVRNGGVPTFGPAEYNQMLAEIVPQRKPKFAIYVVNMANDLFELFHPNTERHQIWDGWAVRKELAPPRVWKFPGRNWMYQRSHAFFAARRWWARSDLLNNQQTPSEGTWSELLFVPTQGRDFIEGSRRVAKPSTRDIVRERMVESARPARRTALHLQRAARDAAFIKSHEARWLKELHSKLQQAKDICSQQNTELLVVVLPIDVQVSKEEWVKYDTEPLDMSATLALNQSVTQTAEKLHLRVVDPLLALRTQQPGMFLHQDLHLTPRGHEVVAKEIASALKNDHPNPNSVQLSNHIQQGHQQKRIRTFGKQQPASQPASQEKLAIRNDRLRAPRGDVESLAQERSSLLLKTGSRSWACKAHTR